MKKIIFVLLLCTSCYSEKRQDINCKYQGAIIYEIVDWKTIDGTYAYHIKYKGEIINYVNVYDIDTTYHIGDTINKPCLNEKH